MARRSTRLSSRNSSTPQPVKRVSLSHETPTARAPRTVPSKLSSLHESDEMPGAFPGSASPSERGTPMPAKRVRRVEPIVEEATPKRTTPIKPSNEEMHPKHVHQTTAKPLEEARWLGFSNMPPATEPPKRGDKLAGAQQTPSKSTKAGTGFKSPEYQFTFRREQSLELSPEAKKFMAEKRAEAMKIKEQMKGSAEGDARSSEALGRRIATPKGNKGRFSDMHAAQFQKMDSIAGHASAFRKGPTSGAEKQVETQTPSKSLKRSPSKAELDKNHANPSQTIPRAQSKSNLFQPAHKPTHATISKAVRNVTIEEPSPAKQNKHTEGADVSFARPSSSNSMDKSLPSTPQTGKGLRFHPSNPNLPQPSYPNLSHLSTPTHSSLARAASVKSAKTGSMIPGLSLARSPSKPQLVEQKKDVPQEETRLLARSPAKVSHTSNAGEVVEKPNKQASPLLSRTPFKGTSKKAQYKAHAETGSPSPIKEQPEPYLSRSPLKASVAKPVDQSEQTDKRSGIPLLSKSPSKMSLSQNPFDSPSGTPAKSTGKGLMGRFNLLRSSPMKSILRSPQRLYSNDPAKVAAGTHMATPPSREKSTTGLHAATAPVSKHVDFSTSTKEREASKSASPSEGPTPPPKNNSKEASPAPIAEYPSLPTIATPFVNPTSERRRQTVAPGDFTFRAGDGIVFGNSPHAPSSASRPQTIRHVSADPTPAPPQSVMGSKKRKYDFENKPSTTTTEASPTHTQGTKKRKFDFENSVAANTAESGGTSDKENGGASEEEAAEDGRPSKRVKTMPPKQAPEKPAKTGSRLPTLGVKPKGAPAGPAGSKEKKTGSISRARLNALAMPKRRG